jgi:hypothetical protein
VAIIGACSVAVVLRFERPEDGSATKMGVRSVLGG